MLILVVPECDICGKSGHIAKDCPIKGKCRKCLQVGHLARECPTVPRTWSDVVDSGGHASAAPHNVVALASGLEDLSGNVDFSDMGDSHLDGMLSQSQSLLAPFAPVASVVSDGPPPSAPVSSDGCQPGVVNEHSVQLNVEESWVNEVRNSNCSDLSSSNIDSQSK